MPHVRRSSDHSRADRLRPVLRHRTGGDDSGGQAGSAAGARNNRRRSQSAHRSRRRRVHSGCAGAERISNRKDSGVDADPARRPAEAARRSPVAFRRRRPLQDGRPQRQSRPAARRSRIHKREELEGRHPRVERPHRFIGSEILDARPVASGFSRKTPSANLPPEGGSYEIQGGAPMSVVDDPRTLGRSRLSFADAADIDEFAAVLGQFERGEIGPDAWRAFRLVRGTYGQRQAEDAQMVRVKIPQGILTAGQLEALADVADAHSRGFGHITTRQNIQFHFVRLHDVEVAMRRLADAGLTTREACGNSVRNITACPYAGVAADELFDVTPYAEALTRHLLRHPLSSRLPRKFKIGFEGCPDDHIRTGINDLGFRAAVAPDGTLGFRVTVAGGTAILCRSGSLLHEFLPADELFDVADAVLRVFAAFGDYQHKQRNRLKFLIKTMGWERWLAEYRAAFDAIRAGEHHELPFDPDDPPIEEAPAWPLSDAPDPTRIAARARAADLRGPGIRPSLIPLAGE